MNVFLVSGSIVIVFVATIQLFLAVPDAVRETFRLDMGELRDALADDLLAERLPEQESTRWLLGKLDVLSDEPLLPVSFLKAVVFAWVMRGNETPSPRPPTVGLTTEQRQHLEAYEGRIGLRYAKALAYGGPSGWLFFAPVMLCLRWLEARTGKAAKLQHSIEGRAERLATKVPSGRPRALAA